MDAYWLATTKLSDGYITTGCFPEVDVHPSVLHAQSDIIPTIDLPDLAFVTPSGPTDQGKLQ